MCWIRRTNPFRLHLGSAVFSVREGICWVDSVWSHWNQLLVAPFAVIWSHWGHIAWWAFVSIYPKWGRRYHYKGEAGAITIYLTHKTILGDHVKDDLAATALVKVVSEAQALQQQRCVDGAQPRKKADEEMEHFRAWLSQSIGDNFYQLDWFHLASRVRVFPLVECWLQDETVDDELDGLLSATRARQRKTMEGCSDEELATLSLGQLSHIHDLLVLMMPGQHMGSIPLRI